MTKLSFKPRSTFTADLKRLSKLDPSIITEVREAIDILLEGDKLPNEFNDHELKRNLSGYHEFHLRDTPNGKQPTAINDVLVVYDIDEDDLILIGIRVGSHQQLFDNKQSMKYRH